MSLYVSPTLAVAVGRSMPQARQKNGYGNRKRRTVCKIVVRAVVAPIIKESLAGIVFDEIISRICYG
jgi:hypothetical protein